ncbi:flagellar hook-length control protein FliK [Candidatus Odyssella thessalonicensis]|uniref:flagellar hook-length control protein FliK n=1 Tax=Candidatus Odyssella thessalonicensis TaxID=84647 RepID=UPI0002DE43A0|nr:flagellar hook-length control protein FliK [Candidatus Odyssella thessalonicensis]
MAVSKTSSLNTASLKQSKQPASDLMESIKSATLGDGKKPFHDLINNDSFRKIATQQPSHSKQPKKQEHALHSAKRQGDPSQQPTIESPKQPIEKHLAGYKDSIKHSDLKTENKIKQRDELSNTASDTLMNAELEQTTSLIQEDEASIVLSSLLPNIDSSAIAALDARAGMPIETPLLFENSENSNLMTTSLRTSKDQELQNWIQSGQVRIESTAPSIRGEVSFESATPFIPEMLAASLENTTALTPQDALNLSQARVNLQGADNLIVDNILSETAAPPNFQAVNPQLIHSKEITPSIIETEGMREKPEVTQMTSLQTEGVEVLSSAAKLSAGTPEVRPSTASPTVTLASLTAPQDQEINLLKPQDKSIDPLASVENKAGLVREGAKIQKTAGFTPLEKLNALQQIKDNLRQSLHKGETHLNIQLKPYELGKVEIKLDISRDGMVSALFKAENKETLEVLNRHSQDFQNIFKDAGLNADAQGMSFSMSQQHNTHGEAEFAFQTRPSVQEEELEVAATPSIPMSSTLSTSSIDISV